MRTTRSPAQATLHSCLLSILLLLSSCISSILLVLSPDHPDSCPSLSCCPPAYQVFHCFLHLLTSDSSDLQVRDGVGVRGDVHHGRDDRDCNGHLASSQIHPLRSLAIPRVSPGGAGKHPYIYNHFTHCWCIRSPWRRTLFSSSPTTHPSSSGI